MIPRKIGKEASLSFIGMGVGQFIRYLFTTLLARWVGVELIGIYSISNAITRIMEVVGKMGLDQGALRAISREPNKQKKQIIILSSLKIGFITGILVMIVQILSAEFLAYNIFKQSELLIMAISIHAISLPFYILINISAAATQAYKLLKYKILVSEFQNPVILLIIMILCYYFYNIESTILVPIVFTSIIGLFSINIFLKKVSGVNLKLMSKGFIDTELISYSLPIMFMTILGTILHWTDVIMLGLFSDANTVGLYHPAARTAGIIRIILLSFTGIYGPIMAEMYAKNEVTSMNSIFKLVTRWIITFSLPFSILILLYPKKIMLIFGSEFVSGYSILVILVIAAMIQAIFGVGGTTLTMTRYPKINLINTFIACSLNIVLNIIFIPIYKGQGAALSTLITLASIALIRIFQNWILLKLLPFNLKIFKPLLAGLVAFGVGVFIKSFIVSFHTIITLLFAGIIIFAAFFIILWLLKFDEDDYNLLKGIRILIKG